MATTKLDEQWWARRATRLRELTRRPAVWTAVGIVIERLFPTGVTNDQIDSYSIDQNIADELFQNGAFIDSVADHDVDNAAKVLLWRYLTMMRPSVYVPANIRRDILSLQGLTPPTTEEAAVIRDMLLSGRDDEALVMLGVHAGARIYWNQDFWRAAIGAPPETPRNTTYAAIGHHDGVDGVTDAREAVGIAIQMFAEWGGDAQVRLDQDHPEFAATHGIIFAIAETVDGLRKIAPWAVEER